MYTLDTIGYESATVASFLAALAEAGVEVLVDVRARAGSRRPGFAKTALAAHLAGMGIEYLHVRALGTPPDGRMAARAGQHEEMREIFRQHLASSAAQDGLVLVADLIRSGRRICLLCLEADPRHCHRSLVADTLAVLLPAEVRHLTPTAE